jgi:hypothetical protein
LGAVVGATDGKPFNDILQEDEKGDDPIGYIELPWKLAQLQLDNLTPLKLHQEMTVVTKTIEVEVNNEVAHAKTDTGSTHAHTGGM